MLQTQEKDRVGRHIIIMPMAGAGSRFTEAGIDTPKPLIEVDGKPMFQAALESLNFDNVHSYVFIVRREHVEAPYNIINRIFEAFGMVPSDDRDSDDPTTPRAPTVIVLDEETEGAAATLLAAREHLELHTGNTAKGQPCITVVNCDQIIEFDTDAYDEVLGDTDAAIMTFECPEKDPKWSYALADEYGSVERVAEKRAISTHATAGVYTWLYPNDMWTSIDLMMAANDRTNGEFYVCPIMNYTLTHFERDVKIFNVDSMHGVGTPEDLQAYNEKNST